MAGRIQSQKGTVHANPDHRQFTGSTLMRTIELTRVFDSGKTEPWFVNPAHIMSFCAAWKEIGSFVVLSGGESFAVKETPEQINSRLADHRSAMHAEEHDGIEIFR